MKPCQLAQEGYSIFQVLYPPASLASLAEALDAAGAFITTHAGNWGLITYGLLQDDEMTIPNLVRKADVRRLKVVVHFSPLSEHGGPLIVHDPEQKYIP